MDSVKIEKVVWKEVGKGISCWGVIPKRLALFKDHFPNFPVLPGVLALDLLKQTAEAYMKEAGISGEKLKEVRAVKFTKYLRPGDEWETKVEVLSQEENILKFNARLYYDNQVAVSAKLIFKPALEATA